MLRQEDKISNILLETISEAVIIVDNHQKIVEVNASAERIFAYKKDELISKDLNILLPFNYHESLSIHFEEFLKTGNRIKINDSKDVFGIKKDGDIVELDIELIPFTIYNKTFAMALISDISEKKRKEEERHHLSIIFDESLNEIHVFDAKTLRFINVNYGAQKSLGYSMEELIDMTPIDITPCKDEGEFRTAIDILLKKNVEKLVIETVQRRKDGTEYPVETHLQLSKLGDREVFVAIILDITERKNYTKKLEKIVEERTQQLKYALDKEVEINQLKSKFLSSLSHEFKTPLSAILTSALLLSKYQLTEQQERRNKHIKTITDKAQILNNILNGFLSIEKFDTGNLSYQFTNFKISEIVDEVIYNARMLIKEGQQIKYTENEDLSLYQDEKIIELILSNLIQNAIKYSPEDTTIYLDIDQDEEITTFKIRDAGVGIPENAQKNIFDRYFRAENVINIEGTGIGLNIVKNHLEKLNGKIYFESKQDVGTTFTVSIPNIAKQ
ncbi:sensor histidine kinase [Yeosuana marina]|uniref:sensor histidine kinase n=1 Tax=Yeosuana marina TaxID=1565536 RepID=UPI0014230472|nr:PAS domain S-box protein [Yeosuana marina]